MEILQIERGEEREKEAERGKERGERRERQRERESGVCGSRSCCSINKAWFLK